MKDKIREAAEYVLNPPTVPCNPPHPGFEVQFESQSTLVENAQLVAQAWLDQNKEVSEGYL